MKAVTTANKVTNIAEWEGAIKDKFNARHNGVGLTYVTAPRPVKPGNDELVVEQVYYKGEIIGRFQTCGDYRLTISDIKNAGSRRGHDIHWLIDQAERDNWLAQNEELRRRQEAMKRRAVVNPKQAARDFLMGVAA